jgi:protein disulfide-isomerase A1
MLVIVFNAAWCGHCKALAPVWEQLGESISSEHVVIAKMDHTANDFADVQIDIQGYPTLALVTAKDNKVVMYEGDRSLKSFQAFLKQNASNGKDIKVEETEETDSEEPERLFTVDDDDEAAKIDDDDADRDEL